MLNQGEFDDVAYMYVSLFTETQRDSSFNSDGRQGYVIT